jgi:large subunit ribosomal protein L28
MSRICKFTGKRPHTANKVSHSNINTKKRQLPNLQTKRIWWPEGSRFVRIRLSTRAMRTLRKRSLDAWARESGIDLTKH